MRMKRPTVPLRRNRTSNRCNCARGRRGKTGWTRLASLSCYSPATSPRQSRYNGGVPFRIRQFEKADFDTLWRIDQACFDPQLAYSRPELAFYIRRPGSFTLVAVDEGGKGRGNTGAAAGASSGGILSFIVGEARRGA